MNMSGVRAVIHFEDVPSIHALFQTRSKTIILYKGPATEKTTKVKTLAGNPSAALVDLKPPQNHQEGVLFTSEIEKGKCVHCGRITKEGRVGVPIRMRDDKFHHILIVDVELCACNYACCHAFLKKNSRDDVYAGRLIILRKIYELLFPGEPFKCAPDFRLLESLSEEEFDSGARVFEPNPCLKYRVCSEVFFEQTS